MTEYSSRDGVEHDVRDAATHSIWDFIPHAEPDDAAEWRTATEDEAAAWETAQITDHTWASLTVPITQPKEN